MGCPPDPVEVSIWRSSERINTLEQKYHRLIDEYSDAAGLAQTLFSDFVRVAGHKTKEFFTKRTDVAPSEYEPYADDRAQYKLESGYAEMVRSLETELCELRTRIVRFKVSEGNREKSAQTDQLEEQVSLHLRHREEDRTQWIQWLADKKSTLEYLLSERDTPSLSRLDRPAAEILCLTIAGEIVRLGKIDAHTLMTERDCLRSDENLYATPYLDKN